MGYRVILYDEDGNNYIGTSTYDTREEAEEEIEDTFNGPTVYIDDNVIVGAEIEEV